MLKRAMDVSVAVLLLIVMSVPMLVVALLVRWTMGAPVFFRQTRPGLHAKPFELTNSAPWTTRPTKKGTRWRTRHA